MTSPIWRTHLLPNAFRDRTMRKCTSLCVCLMIIEPKFTTSVLRGKKAPGFNCEVFALSIPSWWNIELYLEHYYRLLSSNIFVDILCLNELFHFSIFPNWNILKFQLVYFLNVATDQVPGSHPSLIRTLWRVTICMCQVTNLDLLYYICDSSR